MILFLRNSLNISKRRLFSNVASPKSNVLEHLKERSLIRIAGPEVQDYIQGLITNDIHHLEHGVGSMYTMFLNTKGRVMYDAIIYKTSETNAFLIECDTSVSQSLQKHLKLYRVRRKIDINSLSDEFSVYAIFNPDVVENNAKCDKNADDISKDLEGFIVPCSATEDSVSESAIVCRSYRDLSIYRDPRTVMLGSRIIAPLKSDIDTQIHEIFSINTSPKPELNYRWFRYRLGIGEGVNDLPPGNCFPLEANCDYLHGVSFHKGCYIGQELTARTHHTGVIRKRLLPLFFNEIPANLPQDNTILHENVNLGKLRGVEQNVGLALLRIEKTLKFNEIKIGDGFAKTEKPKWWPIEAPKEKILAQKP